jgi:hypothetical protein
MMTEEEIARLFGRAVSNVDWPGIDSAIMGAQRQARRLRRRRRVSLAAGGALAAGVAGVAVAVATGTLPQLPGATSPHDPAGASTTTPAPSAKPPSPTPSQSISTPTTGAQILATLKTLLPAGSAIANVRPLNNTNGILTLELDYNDGQGAVDFRVVISPPIYRDGFVTCSQVQQMQQHFVPSVRSEPQSCTMRPLPDGSTEEDLVTDADSQGFYDLDVSVLKPDGTEIDIEVANGNLDPPSYETVTQAKPPGSFAEWSAVADSPAWHL